MLIVAVHPSNNAREREMVIIRLHNIIEEMRYKYYAVGFMWKAGITEIAVSILLIVSPRKYYCSVRVAESRAWIPRTSESVAKEILATVQFSSNFLLVNKTFVIPETDL